MRLRRAFAATVFAGVIGLAMGGCSTGTGSRTPLAEGSETASEGEAGLVFVLPPWTPPAQPFELQQLLVGRYGAHAFSFTTQVRYDAEALHLVALGPLGGRAMDLRWSGQGVTAAMAVGVPDAVQPERILKDVIMIYWPLETLQEATKSTGFTWHEEGGVRRLSNGADTIVTVRYGDRERIGPWPKQAVLENKALGYTIEAQTVGGDQ